MENDRLKAGNGIVARRAVPFVHEPLHVDLRFLAVRPAGRISGALRPVRVREIDAFAADENRACAAWAQRRSDPV